MEERGDAIVLIGFMGTGKTSVGRAIARRAGLPCYDTDEMVTKRFGASVAGVFSRHGEEVFRDAEAETLERLPIGRSVIVTGGGFLLRDGHLQKIRALGTVVQLTAEIETLVERLSRRTTRPLLQTPDPRTTIEGLLRARGPLYEQAADVTVDTTRMKHDEVAKAVLAAVEGFRRDGI